MVYTSITTAVLIGVAIVVRLFRFLLRFRVFLYQCCCCRAHVFVCKYVRMFVILACCFVHSFQCFMLLCWLVVRLFRICSLSLFFCDNSFPCFATCRIVLCVWEADFVFHVLFCRQPSRWRVANSRMRCLPHNPHRCLCSALSPVEVLWAQNETKNQWL